VIIGNDASAFDDGRRDGYGALVAQVCAGVTDIVIWHVDRLYWQPREPQDLLVASAGRGY
jgi:site-specific DNA recombinase